MTVLNNNFNGGPSGTTISAANSGQFGDNPFDGVDSSGTGTVLTFQDAGVLGLNRPTASFVMEVSTTINNTTPSVWWTTSMGTVGEFWTRFYLNFSGLSTAVTDFCLFEATKGVQSCCSVWLQTSTTPHCLQIQDHVGVNTVNMTIGTVAPNNWYRLEFHALMTTSSNSGSSQLYLYSGADVDTNNYTDTISQTGANYGTALADTYILGCNNTPQNNTPASYFSNWQLNTTGFPGPAPFRAGKGCPGILTNPIAIHSDVC
jgi:hypothetical protein